MDKSRNFQPNEGEEEMKKSWVRHEKLCAQLEACSLDLKQNEAQMTILTATGGELKEKHKKIRGLLDEAKANGKGLSCRRNKTKKVI